MPTLTVLVAPELADEVAEELPSELAEEPLDDVVGVLDDDFDELPHPATAASMAAPAATVRSPLFRPTTRFFLLTTWLNLSPFVFVHGSRPTRPTLTGVR